MVTASIRRISLAGDDESLADLIPKNIHFLPNTAGCQTAKDAILTAELAREALGTNWVKIEVIGDRELLYPDTEELIKATEALVAKGFVVLPYCTEDPVVCRKLADAGAAAVMPLGSLDRLRAWHSQSASDRAGLRALAGAGGARCRHRHRVRRRARHGARLLGGAAQHRGVEGAGPGADGEGDARRRRRRARGAARRADSEDRPCGAVEPAIRPRRNVRLPHPPLLLVTDRRQARKPLTEVVAAALAAGCRWVSVREKDLPEDDQIALVRLLLPIARRNGARLTLHGDAALAKAAGADGVHRVGRHGDAAASRKLLGPDKLIGVSIHTAIEAAAVDPAIADYAIAGPAYETASKPGYGPEIGRKGLADLAKSARVPLVAIGGLNAMRAAEVLAVGVSGIAVMGSIMRAADPGQETKALLSTVAGTVR